MAKSATQLISTRIDEHLKEQFVESVRLNQQTPSEVLRRFIEDYVRETERELIRRDAAEIRANKDDEEDVLNWLGTISVLNETD
ncbi:hypothetical protein [Rhizobium binxianense]|jgi:hypothetical protein